MTAELVAQKYGIPREDADAFALASHQKAVAAIDAGRFKDEIVPLEVGTNGRRVSFDTDEGPRRDTSLAALAGLRPVFATKGSVTAGNASQMSDGAAATVLVSEESARRSALSPWPASSPTPWPECLRRSWGSGR